jgi:large subunit ribosomal protein L23
MQINEVLIKPILTEKATNLTKNQVYMFEVNKKANKHKIKEALEKLYKVKVAKVKVMIKKGKTKKAGRKMKIKQIPDRKIAYIKLTEGKIDLFPQT